MIVEQGQGPVVLTLGIVLPGEGRTLAHLEVRGLAAEDPVEIGRLPVELVHGMGVAGGDEEGLATVVLGHGIEVDVVEGFLLGAFPVLEWGLRLIDGNVAERPPFEQGLSGLDVDLLDHTFPDPAVGGPADRAEIGLRLDIGEQENRVVVGDRRLVQIGGVLGQLTAHADAGDLLIAVVEHDDLPGRVRGLRQTLPPGEHRLILVLLDSQVPHLSGVPADPEGVARGIEDEPADPGGVIGIGLTLRGDEGLELLAVGRHGRRVDVDLRRVELRAGVEVPAFGDSDLVIALGGAPRQQQRRRGQARKDGSRCDHGLILTRFAPGFESSTRPPAPRWSAVAAPARCPCRGLESCGAQRTRSHTPQSDHHPPRRSIQRCEHDRRNDRRDQGPVAFDPAPHRPSRCRRAGLLGASAHRHRDHARGRGPCRVPGRLGSGVDDRGLPQLGDPAAREAVPAVGHGGPAP